MTVFVDIDKLSDAEFVTRFENHDLNPGCFNHKNHLRLAWLYLADYDVATATEKVCSGIKSFAESVGAHTKFHLTITDALVRMMFNRINQMEPAEFEDFLNENGDLLEDAVSVLQQHFSKDLLFSETARTTLVQPDIRPI